MKVAIFHFGFFYSGGGEKLVIREALGLKKMGVTVDCYAPIVEKGKCFPDLIGKINVYPILPMLPPRFPKRDTLQVIGTCLLFPFVSWKYRKYDVVLGANQPGVYFGYVLNKLYNIPYVAYLAQPLRLIHPRAVDKETGLYLRKKMELLPKVLKFFKRIINYLDHQSTKNAGVVLVNGQYVLGKIGKTYGVKPVNCPAGADVIKKPAPYLKRKNAGFLLLTNRHFPQKRFEYAISALPLILKEYPKLNLIITGEKTEYTVFLEELVSRLSLKDRIKFKGFVSEKEAEKLYKNALVYLYTSPDEDFGMGIIEAMGMGTPVVAWNNGGPSFIFEEKLKRYLAEPFDIPDFSQKVINILKNRGSYSKISDSCLNLIKSKYSYDLHNKIIYESLRSVILK